MLSFLFYFFFVKCKYLGVRIYRWAEVIFENIFSFELNDLVCDGPLRSIFVS